MSKIDVKQLVRSFDERTDAIRFEVDGVYFFACNNKETFDRTINDGYEKAGVINIEPVKKSASNPETGGEDNA